MRYIGPQRQVVVQGLTISGLGQFLMSEIVTSITVPLKDHWNSLMMLQV